MPRTKKQNADLTVQSPEEQVVSAVKEKRHRNRPDLAKFGYENAEPGDNTRYLRIARAFLDLPPIDISDEKQVEKRIFEYFDFCEQNDAKPNMVGMANWLGVDRSTLQTWKSGEYRSKTHSPVIKRALDLLEDLWVAYMQNGKINPASGIFLAKNMFQYKDVQDVVLTPNNPLDNMSADDGRKRLVESIPEE